MDAKFSSNESTRLVETKQIFPSGTDTEVLRIESAVLSLMDSDHSNMADVIRVGEFAVRVITQTRNPILISLCMVDELHWPITKDSPILRVGSRSFAFAMPGLLYGLQFSESSSHEDVLQTLEGILMRFGHYEDHSGRVNGIQFSVPENSPCFWSASHSKIERITVPLFIRIGADPGKSLTSIIINGMNEGLSKVIRMSGITKVVAKAVLVGAIDSDHFDIFHVRSRPSDTHNDMVSPPGAFPTIFLFSDMVEAVEGSGLIASGNYESLPPCHPTWMPLPDIKIWNINKKGLILLLQALVTSASASASVYGDEMSSTTEKSEGREKMNWEPMEADAMTGDLMEEEVNSAEPMEEEPKKGEDKAICEIRFPIIVAGGNITTGNNGRNLVESGRGLCWDGSSMN
ncbi:hypothetical protein HHK36_004076 [Tetracentron sinense]|uniref:Uncharacterized protein n=1 Tax=Tetracentron sinense TaxID=13715 RepID=A0A834ZPF0_TETSI|nr:hypothetical protein HHK36_004076 [Tetracentron sinense]